MGIESYKNGVGLTSATRVRKSSPSSVAQIKHPLLKGVVDKIDDAVEIFNAHIRAQGVENPSKYLSLTFVLYFAKMKKYHDYVLNFSRNQSH